MSRLTAGSGTKQDAAWVGGGTFGDVDPAAAADRLVNRRLRSLDGDALIAAAPAWMREAAELQAAVGAALSSFLPRWQAARQVVAFDAALARVLRQQE